MSHSVYLMHDTLTPGNVRRAWHDAPSVPRVGDEVQGDLGYNGARVTWRVERVEWMDGVSGRAAMLHMSGPTGKPEE